MAVDDMAVDEASSPTSHITELASVIAPDGSTEATAVSANEPEPDPPAEETMSARAYQLEMLQQSLKRNVIVVMDTGSGKTQVAVLRIKAELEKSSPDKIIWFLAPTVSLCEQQCEVIRLQNPSVAIEVLTGNDSVESWSLQTWQDILSRTRVLVTTFQVLLDALTHGFVNMKTLALLVMDEAHNCKGNSPGCQIMTKFYHQAKAANEVVPAILGLTASPIMRSDPKGIRKLEEVMDAHCITPILHRDELLRCVNKPELIHLAFEPVEFPEHTPTMESLRQAYQGIDIKTDPQIRQLLKANSERARCELRRVIFEHDTYTQTQMKAFWGRSKEVLNQLGPWAVDHYISKVIRELLQRVDSAKADDENWPNEDKRYLANCLRKVSLSPVPTTPPDPSSLSNKANLLIKELVSAVDNVVGIIFVKERATVTILTDLLTTFPAVLEKYRIGTMVGTSNFQARNKNVYEFSNNVGLASLQDFQSGKINLLVATSVVEEGIDVPACNLVICYEKPANLKSFIQRRGRARMKQSKLVVFSERSAKGPTEWEALEEEMKRQYQQEREELSRLEELEAESAGSLYFEVPSTGARLDLDNAKAHLEHFCRVASRGEYIDCRPDYVFQYTSEGDESSITATVLLPSFLEPGQRTWSSGSAWRSQKNATKDAAFHAYVALYQAGLINDNLLPIKDTPVEEREPVAIEVPSFNPWKEIAHAWEDTGDKWVYPLRLLDKKGASMGEYNIVLPVQIPQPRPIKIHPGWADEWKIEIGAGRAISHHDAMKLPDHTSSLLALHFGYRWNVEDRNHVIKVFSNEPISNNVVGAIPFDPARHDPTMPYLVRDGHRNNTPYELTGLLPSKPPIEEVQHAFIDYKEAPDDVPYLTLRKVSRRADFLHRVMDDPRKGPSSSKPYSSVLPMSWAAVDDIPKRFAQFSMLIPSVIHELEVMITAVQLNKAVLKPVGITDLHLIVEAISSRNAIEPVNYERLEFLGDSILKFCTVVQVSAQYPTWPEGFLSFLKDRQVSNFNLLEASVRADLPKFILTKSFTGAKWRPIYADDVLQEESVSQKPLSSKTLADVVEALIGASYLNGGIPKALKCISVFLSGGGKHKMKWFEELGGRQKLFDNTVGDVGLPSTLQPLEEFIGYSFKKKALLIEAMTHASHTPDSGWRSLERLEFLGDAVLDYIIVTRMFKVTPPLAHYNLHLLKTAMVNGDFLGFITLEHGLKTKEAAVNDNGDVEEREVTLPLWKFMRHAAPAIGVEQMATSERFESLRGDIVEALTQGTHYPWALLTRLRAKKFYSDLLEALIGAVWVDSGCMETCEAVLGRFSILDYLERMLRDNVHILHPKEELGLLSASESVLYRYERVESAGGEKEHRCTVKVGGRVVAHAEGALSMEEAKTKAAELAVKFLTAQKMAVD